MSVSFEPGPIARRRRLPDRAGIVALLVLAFVGLAIVKPWSSAAPAASTEPSTAPSPPASTAPDAVPADELAAVLPPHDAWGVRVVAMPAPSDPAAELVRLPNGTTLAQGWIPVPPLAAVLGPVPAAATPPITADRLPRVVLGERGAIRFLGLTSPSRDPAVDVRVSRVGPDVPEPRWLDVRLPVGDLGLGEWLLPPPWIAGRELDEWPAGTYRVDILRAGPVERLLVEIPPVDARPTEVPAEPVLHIADPEAGGGWPPGAGLGSVGFVIADGQAIALPGRLGPPLDERAAWLAAASSDRDPAPAVVHGWLPSATGIGLQFPPKARSITATLRRIAPAFVASLGALRTGSVHTADGDAPWAIVDATSGATLPPGSYRLDVSWRDGNGDRTYGGSVHLELEPGPLGILPRWLSTGRGMAQWAGQSGIVVGLAGRIEGASTDSLMRLLPEAPRSIPTTAEALGPACEGAVLAEAGDAVLGLVHDARWSAVDVHVDRLVADGAEEPMLVRASLEVVPGLVLIAPDGPWQPGRFAITLVAADRVETSVLCLGTGSPLRVPSP